MAKGWLVVDTSTRPRMTITLVDGATITVRRVYGRDSLYLDDAGARRVYAYTLRDADGVVSGRELRGPCGRYTQQDAPTVREMMGALLDFLAAGADRWQLAVVDMRLPVTVENRLYDWQPVYDPVVSPDADAFAWMHGDAIAIAIAEAVA